MIKIILFNLILILILLFLVSWLFISLIVYFVPLIIAYIRKHNNIIAISVLNIVLGWTFLGWIASLLWALNSDTDENENNDD